VKTKYTKLYEIQQIYGFSILKPLSLVLSLFSAIVLACREWDSPHFAIVMLPAVFLLTALLFDYNKNVKGLGSFIVVIAYLLRFTVFPVIISLGSYRTDVEESVYLPYFDQACVIMIIELLAVFLLLSWLGTRSYRKHRAEAENVRQNASENPRKYKSVKAIIFVLLAYVLFVAFCFPQLFTTYWRIIFFMGDSFARLERLNALISQIPGIIYYPFKYSAELLHYLIPIYLVARVNHSRLTVAQKWAVTLLIAIAAFSVLTSEQINSIIVVLCIVIYMLVSHKQSSKIIVPLGVVGAAFVSVFVLKNIANVFDVGSLGRILNNYFEGPINVALSVHMKVHSDLGIGGFFADIVKNIPVLERLVSHPDLNIMFGDEYGMPGAIIPMSGYGFYYFGYIGSCLPALAVVLAVNWFDELQRKSRSGIGKLIMYVCTVHLSLSVFMYTLCIVYANIIPFFLPMLIVRYFAENRRIVCNVPSMQYAS